MGTAIAAATSAGDVFNASYQQLEAEGYGPYLDQLATAGYDLNDAILQAQFKRATDEVHALSVSIAAATKAGQTVAAAQLQAQLTYWLDQMGIQRQAAHASEAPSAVLVALDHFSDQAIATAGSVGKTGLSLLSQLPLILWAVVLLAVLYLAWSAGLFGRPKGAA